LTEGKGDFVRHKKNGMSRGEKLRDSGGRAKDHSQRRGLSCRVIPILPGKTGAPYSLVLKKGNRFLTKGRGEGERGIREGPLLWHKAIGGRILSDWKESGREIFFFQRFFYLKKGNNEPSRRNRGVGFH